jgi:hypothetical protein
MYFTYCLTFKSSGQRYYGVRYAKGCHPSDLWTIYFSSSWLIKKLIKSHGLDAFSYEIRRTFDSPEKARIWEAKVLRRLNAADNLSWLNLSNSRIRSSNKVRNQKIDIAYNEILPVRKTRSEHSRSKQLNSKWMYNPKTGKEHSVQSNKRLQFEADGYLYGRSLKCSEWTSSSAKKRTGEKNGAYGRKRSDLSARNRLPKAWINNGINSKLVNRSELNNYPDYIKGRLPLK